MKKGFDRLKGVAAASAMGVGLIGGGSARAATTTVPLGTSFTTMIAATINGKSASATLTSIGGWSTADTFDIGEMSFSNSTGTGYYDSFDGALGMMVDGTAFQNPTATIQVVDDEVHSDTMVDIVAGIDAEISYQFFGGLGGDSLGVVRAVYSVTNTTVAEKAVTLTVFGNLGSDGSTTVQASSSGDLITDGADTWTITNDSGVAGQDSLLGDDPTLLITRYGTGATVVPTAVCELGGADSDCFENDYALTIAPGETQNILVFVAAHKTIAGAEAAAATYTSLSKLRNKGLIPALTAAEKKSVVNYKYVPPSSDSGATGLLALFGLLGVPALLRRFRKTDA